MESVLNLMMLPGPHLGEEWPSLLREIGDKLWGANLTRREAHDLLRESGPGTMVVYAPEDMYSHRVCSLSRACI